MSSDFCLSCGALMVPDSNRCRICGFNNAFDQEDPVILEEEDVAGDGSGLGDGFED